MNPLQCAKRIKRDDVTRRKLCITLAVFYSYMLQGWSEQQIGMSLPTLQRRIGVNLSTMSFTVIAWLIGCVLGSLVSGVMFDTYNRLLLMGVVAIGLVASTITLPFCTSLIWMLICRFVFGVFNGANDTGCNTIIPTLWGDACGPFVQMMYVCYALGGIISPFITIPFMSRDNVENVTSSSSSSNLNDTITDAMGTSPNIHITFIITGLLYLICAVPYLKMKSNSQFNAMARRNSLNSDSTGGHDSAGETNKISPKAVVVICLMAGVYASYIATEDSLVTYLPTFTLEYLEWSEVESATFVSTYWISSFGFGLLSILLVSFVDPANILWVSLLITNCGLGLAIVGHYSGQSWLFWTGFVTSGSTTILVQTTVVTWSQKYACEISGRVSSVLIVLAGMWSSAYTYFVSYMMDNFSQLYLVFTILGGTMLCLLLYVSAYFIRFKISGPSTNCCYKNVYNTMEHTKRPTQIEGVSIIHVDM